MQTHDRWCQAGTRTALVGLANNQEANILLPKFEAKYPSLKVQFVRSGQKMNLQAASLGNVPSIVDEDIAEFNRREGRGNSSVEGLWRYYCEWLVKG